MAEPRPGLLLWVLSGNMLLDAVEVSVVLPALAPARTAFGLSPVGGQWLLSGFALGFAALLLPGPWSAARWGRRRVYLAAMVVFVLASVLGGLTGSVAVLIASRVVKGGCAALTAPAGLAIITTAVPEGAARRRALAGYALAGAAGFTTGLLLSGVLAGIGWRWVFFAPALVASALLAGAVRVIPVGRGPAPARPGAAVLRDRSLLRAGVGAAALNGTYIGLLLVVVTELAGRGLTPWLIAVALLPASLPLAVAAPFGPRLAGKFGTPWLIAAGALCAFAGAALFLTQPAVSPYATTVLPVLLFVEAGFVLAFAALNIQATATIPAASRGVAVPVYQTFVQLGSALVLPFVALLLAGGGARAAAVLLTAIAALGAVVAVLPVVRTPRKARHDPATP
ncbi:MFS transporter [Amycolatopsis kentuckyensis]|uniref:MFS transporter n=1 Tax=Amycolatopsis kentuckyensis TaxID=218823 RepID=UPI000A383972|nr:MFS transporter [Amycolatopsis kentuckyensis]